MAPERARNKGVWCSLTTRTWLCGGWWWEGELVGRNGFSCCLFGERKGSCLPFAPFPIAPFYHNLAIHPPTSVACPPVLLSLDITTEHADKHPRIQTATFDRPSSVLGFRGIPGYTGERKYEGDDPAVTWESKWYLLILPATLLVHPFVADRQSKRSTS